MTDVTAPSPPRSRIATASLIGTAIEFYDFYIYGTAAALVFGKVFFPSFSPIAGTLASLAVFAVGFAARPLGAILFGHFGDRIGRKRVLITSLLLMGGATVAVGLIPSYASIGTAAPALLVTARILQGIGLGGEWGGAVLLATEYAPSGKRGLYSAFPQLGPAIGFVIGNLVFLVMDETVSGASFQSVGWRIPFLVSAVLLLVGYYVRMRLSETPIFQAALHRQRQVRVPFIELIRRQPRVLILATLSFILAHTLFYTVTTFVLSYGTKTLNISSTSMLVAALISVALMGVLTMYFAMQSDRLGRKPFALGAAALAALWAFPMFWLIDTRNVVLVAVGMTGGMTCFGMLYGPMGAYLPELFKVHYRYSGASLAYNVAGIIGGGVSPLAATALLAVSRTSTWVCVYLIGIALICLASVVLLAETKDSDFADGLQRADAVATAGVPPSGQV